MHNFMKNVDIYLKLHCNFWRTHVMNFIANLLAGKFMTLFGSGASPDVIQRRNAVRHSRNRISNESLKLDISGGIG